ncbi:hypothetical protein [Raineyella antarctica]|nr:hypothetical protein [Raineyella antarctica]
MQHARLKTTTTSLALVLLALLAGCGDSALAGPSSSPVPTWTCTPDASGSLCTQEKAAAQAEEAAAYAEAEHVYREFTKERNRLAMAGGSATPTAEMARLATGNYLDTVADFLATGHEAGRRATAPLEIINVEPRTYVDGRVTMLSCEDGSRIQIIDSSGSVVGTGAQGSVEIAVEHFPEGWKLVDGSDSEESVCD